MLQHPHPCTRMNFLHVHLHGREKRTPLPQLRKGDDGCVETRVLSRWADCWADNTLMFLLCYRPRKDSLSSHYKIHLTGAAQFSKAQGVSPIDNIPLSSIMWRWRVVGITKPTAKQMFATWNTRWWTSLQFSQVVSLEGTGVTLPISKAEPANGLDSV